MEKSPAIVLALDGHDGTGKTTLARQLAGVLNARYVRPYGEPYGPALLEAADKGDYASILKTGREAVETVLKESSDHPVLIFDRLWITLFTLLPPELHAQWTFRPPTAICWADLPTTLTRLGQRIEDEYDKQWHINYIELYSRLSRQYQCELIPTHELNEKESLDRLVIWAKGYL